MNEDIGVLAETLTAQRLERWRAATSLTAHGTFGGLLKSRFLPPRESDVAISMPSLSGSQAPAAAGRTDGVRSREAIWRLPHR